jgi:hypothetical protein
VVEHEHQRRTVLLDQRRQHTLDLVGPLARYRLQRQGLPRVQLDDDQRAPAAALDTLFEPGAVDGPDRAWQMPLHPVAATVALPP